MVWVLHKKTQNYISKVNEIRSAQKPPYSTLRIVSNMNELKEKVSCLESMRDDRIIELYKVFSVYNLLSQRPRCQQQESTTSFRNSKHEEAKAKASKRAHAAWVNHAYHIMTNPQNHATEMRSDFFLQNTNCTKGTHFPHTYL